MKILITNVYSYKNKGDAAIVVSLIKEIRRVFGQDTDILAQTADIKHDEGKYDVPVTQSLLWTLLSRVRDDNIIKRLYVPIKGICSLSLYLFFVNAFQKELRFLLNRDMKQFVDENKQADLVIACGGGYLRTAHGSLRETILLFVTCLNFLTAKYLGKQVYLYSQSIGPVHGSLQEKMLKFTLDRVDIVQPREDVSVAYLQKLGIKAQVVPTADAALLLGGTGIFPERVAKLDEQKMHVGLTVRKWFKDKAQLEAYESAVAQNIDYLIEKHNAQVFYIPQVIAENFGDDDRIVAKEVWEKVQNKDLFTVVDADLHPFEVIGLCGAMDIFIGTRMHSNIFSLISKVPVVAIEYEHKTRGIMRGLGLEDLTIDIKDVTPQTLQQRIDLLLNNKDTYRTRLIDNLPGQVAEGQKAINSIKAAYEGTI
ncbi:MAG TPA: polysaccharide pyruvyl transferase family protein [Candidatus Saccharimonadales bacterium]|nr:polysaccharide pyruvyl transferase family protein [Candidatus Saccharimonadales bacterium]